MTVHTSQVYSAIALTMCLSICMDSARGEDSPDALNVIRDWGKRASEITTIQVHTSGTRIDHSPGFGKHGDAQRDRECMRQIDYHSSAPHDVERYHRLSENLTESGIRLCDFTMVRSKGLNKRFLPGSHGNFDHDQIQYDRFGAEFDVEVSVIRWFINKSADNTNYFERSSFVAVQSTRVIDDVPCAAVETRGEKKIRFWYEVSRPLRIRLIEYDIDRNGYHMRYEYRLGYDIPNEYDLPSTVSFFDYKPHGRGLDAVVSVDSIEWKINEPLPSNWSKLPDPPGAAVMDYTANPTKYFVQVSAGNRRPLSEKDFGLHRFRTIASEIAGSRIEGKYPADRLQSTGGQSRWWLVLGNFVLIVTGMVFMRKRNRCAQFQEGGSK